MLLCIDIQKWYLVTKIVLTAVRKKCSGDREKVLKFEAEGQEFVRTVKFFGNRMVFYLFPGGS